jgi:hypothetical protein
VTCRDLAHEVMGDNKAHDICFLRGFVLCICSDGDCTEEIVVFWLDYSLESYTYRHRKAVAILAFAEKWQP